MATKTLIVMSDSHGDREIVEEIKQHYYGKVDALFHNGDSELLGTDTIWEGIYVVGGNCDYSSDYDLDSIVQLNDLKIIQTHGHLYNINFTWQKLDLLAQQEDADLCFYGHLHCPAAWKNGKTIFVNPGSVSQPRGEVTEKLYAKIEVTDDKIRVSFLTLDHNIYPSLTQEFKR